jgi:hypothetical protein
MHSTNNSRLNYGIGVLYPLRQGSLIWYTDGSKTDEGTGTEVYGHGMRQKCSFSLGRSVFQAIVYAIKACAEENTKRGYRNRNIYILLNSQAAIKALDNCKIYSRLVWDCHQSLMTLAVCNKVYLCECQDIGEFMAMKLWTS